MVLILMYMPQAYALLVAGAGALDSKARWLLEKAKFVLNHFPKTARFKNTRTLTLRKSTTKWL